MKVDLIQIPNRDNVVPDVLSRREEFQAMRTIQTLWLMFASKGNLWCKIWEGYMNYPEASRWAWQEQGARKGQIGGRIVQI